MASPGVRDTEIEIQTSSFQKVEGIPTETWSATKTLWGNVEVRQAQRITVGDAQIDAQISRLRFDWLDAQDLAAETRFVIRGVTYEPISFDFDTDRRSVVIVDVRSISTDAGSVEAEWVKKMRDGEIIRIQDRSKEPIRETFVRAKGEFLQPEELTVDLQQGSRRYFVMAEDVDPAMDPIKVGYYVRVRNDRLFIESVDDQTYRIGGRLIVYVLLCKGNTPGGK